MTLQTIEDLREPPVIGRYYLVPCVYYWYDYRLRWWPVTGPRHEDAEHLDFAAVHYHFDRRFLPARMFSDHVSRIHPSRLRYWGVTPRHPDTTNAARPLSEFASKPHPWRKGEYGGPMPAPVLRRRKCIVADVGFPSVDAGGERFERFHAAYEGKRCGRDAAGRLICPHKGALLDSIAPDKNGIGICPLHGLAIDMREGTVVRRPRGKAVAG